ncbi:MAG TPA: AI-2E family transporter [Thermodesulfobacteriota bacterium]|nr:AI-2E family transporter [Thermodesulfobacteriota bacterium]
MNPPLRMLVGAACIVIIIAGMHAAASIVGFVFFAALLANSIVPIVDWMERKGLKHSLALSITIIVLIIGGMAITTLVGASLSKLIQTLPTYESQLTGLKESVKDILIRIKIDPSELFSSTEFDSRAIIRTVGSFLGTVLKMIGNSIFLLILIALMVIEITNLEKKLQEGRYTQRIINARRLEVRKDIRKFVSITALVGFLTACGNLILLVILGVDFALLWAVLSFLFSFIPAVGGILSLIPPFLLAFLEFGWTKAIIVAVGFIVINNVCDNVIKPKLMKQGLDISILLIFLSLLFWNWVLGPIGVILAIPLTLVIKRTVAELSRAENQTELGPGSS